MNTPGEDPLVEAQDRPIGIQQSLISLAFVTGMVLVPIVVAVGLLTNGDSRPRLPSSVAEAPLRGTLEVTSQLATVPRLPARRRAAD